MDDTAADVGTSSDDIAFRGGTSYESMRYERTRLTEDWLDRMQRADDVEGTKRCAEWDVLCVVVSLLVLVVRW